MRNFGRNALLSAAPAATPQLVPFSASPQQAGLSRSLSGEFMKHPRDFPLSCRTVRKWWPWQARERRSLSRSGIAFHSRRAFPLGSDIELVIVLRRRAVKFTGTIVLIRELSDGFEIAASLTEAELPRARLVERICELESRLLASRGPTKSASAESRAQEWARLKPGLEKIPSLHQLIYMVTSSDASYSSFGRRAEELST